MPRRISDRRWKKKAGAQRLEQSTKSTVSRRVPCTLQIQKTRVETHVLSCSRVIALSCSNSKSNTLILQLPLEISTMRSGHCVVMLSCCRYIIETQNWVKHNRRKELLVRLMLSVAPTPYIPASASERAALTRSFKHPMKNLIRSVQRTGSLRST